MLGTDELFGDEELNDKEVVEERSTLESELRSTAIVLVVVVVEVVVEQLLALLNLRLLVGKLGLAEQ